MSQDVYTNPAISRPYTPSPVSRAARSTSGGGGFAAAMGRELATSSSGSGSGVTSRQAIAKASTASPAGSISANSPLIYASQIPGATSWSASQSRAVDYADSATPAAKSTPARQSTPAPDVLPGLTVTEDAIYFKGDYVAKIDLTRGGALTELYRDDQQLLAGQGAWMHSSPEGAADGTGLGYDIGQEHSPTVTVKGDTVTVQGRLYQSNGSGQYAGHRYRITYNFESDDSYTAAYDMWMSPEDVADAQAQFGLDPAQYYVWAVPMDAYLDDYYWNAATSWEGVANKWEQKGLGGGNSGTIPDRPAGEDNWGLTTTPDYMGKTPTATIYDSGGAAIRRQVIGGDLAQVNFWRNTAGHDDRTLEFSVIGGDRRYFDASYDIPDTLDGGEVYSFTERVSVGSADELVPGRAWG